MEQRSDEWFAARLGKVTASRVSDVIAKTKSGWGAGRKNYMSQLLCERLTGLQQDSFTNAAMQWGTEIEPRARAAYQFLTDNTVQEVGFVDHPSIDMSGASPDGLIGNIGLIEIKCPNTATHLDTLLNETIPDKYIVQMQWQMACTATDWCDFVSFDPRIGQDHEYWCKRIDRDEKRIGELEELVAAFLSELDDMMEQLNQRKAA